MVSFKDLNEYRLDHNTFLVICNISIYYLTSALQIMPLEWPTYSSLVIEMLQSVCNCTDRIKLQRRRFSFY